MNDRTPDVAALDLKNIHKKFRQGVVEIPVLRGVSLCVRAGEIVGLLGPSGCGKSTLLHIAGLLDKPSEGEVAILGESCSNRDDGIRTLTRRLKIGFVYQFHHLLPEFSALENAAMPQRLKGARPAEAVARAETLLSQLGLGERLRHRPAELSGGEQQRVAIARALANNPVLLLADEPTGNLDEATADKVFDALLSLVRERKLAALIATHNSDLARRMDRVVYLHNGRIEEQSSVQ